MNHDINITKLKLNCFRQSKIPGEFMFQIRIPGGTIESKYLDLVKHISQTWGDGTFHMGTRQFLSMPGIKFDDIPAVNAYAEQYIEAIEVELCGVDMKKADGQKGNVYDPKGGYPTIGARNIVACIGNSHCVKANCQTWGLARKLEKEIFPSNYHIKMNIAGCPNDCSKAHFCDFGIIGVTLPEYITDRCIGCGRCTKVCKSHATGVLELVNGKVEKDVCCCVGCGECVEACPTSAWVRPEQKLYRMIIGGRTGKQYPRMGKMFLNWVTEEVIVDVVKNWQSFSSNVLHHKPEYLHGGHLIDRAGYMKFKKMMLDGVNLNPEAKVAQRIMWAETEYRSNINVKPIADHPSSGDPI